MAVNEQTVPSAEGNFDSLVPVGLNLGLYNENENKDTENNSHLRSFSGFLDQSVSSNIKQTSEEAPFPKGVGDVEGFLEFLMDNVAEILRNKTINSKCRYVPFLDKQTPSKKRVKFSSPLVTTRIEGIYEEDSTQDTLPITDDMDQDNSFKEYQTVDFLHDERRQESINCEQRLASGECLWSDCQENSLLENIDNRCDMTDSGGICHNEEDLFSASIACNQAVCSSVPDVKNCLSLVKFSDNCNLQRERGKVACKSGVFDTETVHKGTESDSECDKQLSQKISVEDEIDGSATTKIYKKDATDEKSIDYVTKLETIKKDFSTLFRHKQQQNMDAIALKNILTTSDNSQNREVSLLIENEPINDDMVDWHTRALHKKITRKEDFVPEHIKCWCSKEADSTDDMDHHDVCRGRLKQELLLHEDQQVPEQAQQSRNDQRTFAQILESYKLPELDQQLFYTPIRSESRENLWDDIGLSPARATEAFQTSLELETLKPQVLDISNKDSVVPCASDSNNMINDSVNEQVISLTEATLKKPDEYIAYDNGHLKSIPASFPKIIKESTDCNNEKELTENICKQFDDHAIKSSERISEVSFAVSSYAANGNTEDAHCHGFQILSVGDKQDKFNGNQIRKNMFQGGHESDGFLDYEERSITECDVDSIDNEAFHELSNDAETSIPEESAVVDMKAHHATKGIIHAVDGIKDTDIHASFDAELDMLVDELSEREFDSGSNGGTKDHERNPDSSIEKIDSNNSVKKLPVEDATLDAGKSVNNSQLAIDKGLLKDMDTSLHDTKRNSGINKFQHQDGALEAISLENTTVQQVDPTSASIKFSPTYFLHKENFVPGNGCSLENFDKCKQRNEAEKGKVEGIDFLEEVNAERKESKIIGDCDIGMDCDRIGSRDASLHSSITDEQEDNYVDESQGFDINIGLLDAIHHDLCYHADELPQTAEQDSLKQSLKQEKDKTGDSSVKQNVNSPLVDQKVIDVIEDQKALMKLNDSFARDEKDETELSIEFDLNTLNCLPVEKGLYIEDAVTPSRYIEDRTSQRKRYCSSNDHTATMKLHFSDGISGSDIDDDKFEQCETMKTPKHLKLCNKSPPRTPEKAFEEDDSCAVPSPKSAVFNWNAKRKLLFENTSNTERVCNQNKISDNNIVDQRIVPCLQSPPCESEINRKRKNFQSKLRLGLSRRRNARRLHPYWSAGAMREDRRVPDVYTMENEE